MANAAGSDDKKNITGTEAPEDLNCNGDGNGVVEDTNDNDGDERHRKAQHVMDTYVRMWREQRTKNMHTTEQSDKPKASTQALHNTLPEFADVQELEKVAMSRETQYEPWEVSIVKENVGLLLWIIQCCDNYMYASENFNAHTIHIKDDNDANADRHEDGEGDVKTNEDESASNRTTRIYCIALLRNLCIDTVVKFVSKASVAESRHVFSIDSGMCVEREKILLEQMRFCQES